MIEEFREWSSHRAAIEQPWEPLYECIIAQDGPWYEKRNHLAPVVRYCCMQQTQTRNDSANQGGMRTTQRATCICCDHATTHELQVALPCTFTDKKLKQPQQLPGAWSSTNAKQTRRSST